MYEEFLEDIAQTNGLREVNTYLKLIAGVGAILLCLLASSYIPPHFIAIILFGTILVLARIDARTYGELFIIPFSFAVMSIAVIILVSGGGEVYWSWNPVSWFSLSITSESVNEGFFVFCRVIGGMSALIFIALTTPMTDLFAVMRQCRLPEGIIDLTMMIYRSIFILIDQLIQTYYAQLMRLGYGSSRESIRSFATLCGSVFIASWDAGEDFIKAMDARCYSGKFVILGETREVEIAPALAVVVFLMVSSLVIIATRDVVLI